MKASLLFASLMSLSMLGLVGCEEKSGNGTTDALKEMGDKASDAAKDAADSMKDVADDVTDAAKDAADQAKDAASDVADAARDNAVRTSENAMGVIKEQVDKLKGLNVPDSMRASFDEAMKSINADWSKADGLIGELKTAGVEKWKGIADQLTPLLDSLKKQVGDAMAKFGAGQ